MLPFEFLNAQYALQNMLNKLIGYSKFISDKLDEVLIFSRSLHENIDHIWNLIDVIIKSRKV